jgi:hypothetical protein
VDLGVSPHIGVNLYVDGRSEIEKKKDGNLNLFLRCVVTLQVVHCFSTCSERAVRAIMMINL